MMEGEETIEVPPVSINRLTAILVVFFPSEIHITYESRKRDPI